MSHRLVPARYSYLSALTCSACGQTADPDAVQWCARLRPGPVRDLRPRRRASRHAAAGVRAPALGPVALPRAPSRPCPAIVHSLDEGATPLLQVPQARGDAVGLAAGQLLVRDGAATRPDPSRHAGWPSPSPGLPSSASARSRCHRPVTPAVPRLRTRQRPESVVTSPCPRTFRR